MKITAAYVHIPFCLRKCNYCDFASRPLAQSGLEPAAYPQLLSRELALWREEADFSGLQTVYLGGGTPSLLAPDQVREILSLFPPVGEITLEANPETVDEAKLAGFRKAGVNRLSLGAQSFDPELLQAMGRGHDGRQVVQAVAAARRAGFDNISLDLIYGLPGQGLDQWRHSLEQALALQPRHISLYGLSLHENTPWGRALAAGELSAPDEDLAADMLDMAMDLLPRAGLEQYEIANFAQPGYASQHNCAYWRRDNYLGLGPSAASCLANHRFANTPDLDLYREGLRQGRLPWAEDQVYDMDQVLGEAMFLGLRLLAGVEVAAYEQRYGVSPLRRFRHELDKLSRQGLIVCTQNNIRLSRRGVALGNRVFEEFV